MKTKFLTRFIIITIAIISFFSCYSVNNVKIVKADYNENSSEIVMETISKRVLHEKNAHDKRFMASTTKILTAITVIENCSLDDKVSVTKDTTNIEGSSIYLEEGEILTVKELLYGLMLRSGNDCACTLAKHCSNSIEDFADLMNNTAKKIGANNSNFTNPHGLHDDNHYTTAYDLALITCYAMQNNDFREIVSAKFATIPHTKREYNRRLKNKNKLLFNFDGATGVKTGYTKKAGRCLVASAKRGNIEIVSVVLNLAPMFERSSELLEQNLQNYNNVKILDCKDVVGFIQNSVTGEYLPLYIKQDLIVPLSKIEEDNIEIVFDYPKTLPNNIKKGDVVGFIKIYSQNNLIFQEKIYIMVV